MRDEKSLTARLIPALDKTVAPPSAEIFPSRSMFAALRVRVPLELRLTSEGTVTAPPFMRPAPWVVTVPLLVKMTVLPEATVVVPELKGVAVPLLRMTPDPVELIEPPFGNVTLEPASTLVVPAPNDGNAVPDVEAMTPVPPAGMVTVVSPLETIVPPSATVAEEAKFETSPLLTAKLCVVIPATGLETETVAPDGSVMVRML